MGFIKELQDRGLLKDCIMDISETEDHLRSSRNIYVGFDPTARSLTIGNLLPLIVLKIAEKYGHIPVIIVGGATSRIGDPSERTSKRIQNSLTVTHNNSAWITNQILSIMGSDVCIHNNESWLLDVDMFDFMNTVGRSISMNKMIKRSFVKNRNDISLNEFMYSVLQGYDFYHLNQHHNVTMQIGGSDQWGNMLTGHDIIESLDPKNDAFGLTFPLITKSNGEKFGKSSSDETIWLDPKLTSPFDFYQFWMSLSDSDAIRMFRMFMFDLSINEIDIDMNDHANNPESRYLQSRLAFEMTKMIHGEKTSYSVFVLSTMLFGSDDMSCLTQDALIGMSTIMKSYIAPTDYEISPPPFLKILVDVGVISSMRCALELMVDGAITLNGVTMKDKSSSMNNGWNLVRIGKNKFYLVDIKTM